MSESPATPLDLAFLDRLSRWPDIEGPDLVAADPADRLILDEAAAAFSANELAVPGAIAVVGDLYGALTLGAIGALGARGVRSHTDELTGEHALGANAQNLGQDDDFTSFDSMRPDLLDGARIVLIRLPRSLDALTEIVDLVARHAAPDVTILAGARVKYMSRGMNDVLGSYFEDVSASLARGKSRVLIARKVRATLPVATFPQSESHDVGFGPDSPASGGLRVLAHGAVFAGTKLDIGTRFLLEQLDRVHPDAQNAVDLGCGTGVLAAAFALERPGASVIATDQSAAAVASARATADANGVGARVATMRDDAMSAVPDASVDVVLCNPPFHVGSAVHTGTSSKMFRAAARVLRPGGELWTVYNSHLQYKPELARLIGRTEQMAKNPKFTVTRSIKRTVEHGA